MNMNYFALNSCITTVRQIRIVHIKFISCLDIIILLFIAMNPTMSIRRVRNEKRNRINKDKNQLKIKITIWDYVNMSIQIEICNILQKYKLRIK